MKVKFCPSCGENLKTSKYLCLAGHVMKANQKFCGVCGSGPNSKNSTRTTGSPSTRDLSPILNENYVQPSPGPSATNETYPVDLAGSFQSQSIQKKFELGSKKSLIGISSAIFTLVVVLLVIGNVAKAEPVTIAVEMTIKDESCWSLSWGYGDIPSGQIIVSVDGEAAGFGSYPPIGSTSILGCKFTAFIDDVPSDGESYSVSMASGRRGTVYETKADLENNDWTFSLSLN
jgi:hypothetical protein